MDPPQKWRIITLSTGFVLGILGCLVVGLLLERTLERSSQGSAVTGIRTDPAGVTVIHADPAELTPSGPAVPSAR